MIAEATIRGEQQIRLTIYLQVMSMLVAVVASLGDVNAWYLSSLLVPFAPVCIAVAVCSPIYVLAWTFQVRPSFVNMLMPLTSAASSIGIFFGMLPLVQ